jgi:hypothetical protein
VGGSQGEEKGPSLRRALDGARLSLVRCRRVLQELPRTTHGEAVTS